MNKENFWWEDKAIQLPKGLLIVGVPGEALAVYAKMKGFGKEARSSIGALSKRLGWSTGKTRTWQRWLEENKWIVLLKEGENKKPREWWLCSNPSEQPSRVPKTDTLPPQEQGAENPPPGKPIPEANKEVLQANKEEQAPVGISFKGAVDLFYKRWAAKMGEGNIYRLTPADRMNLARFLKDPIGEAAFGAVLKAYLASNDRFIASKGYPLLYLVTQWNAWAQAAKQPVRGEGGSSPEMAA